MSLNPWPNAFDAALLSLSRDSFVDIFTAVIEILAIKFCYFCEESKQVLMVLQQWSVRGPLYTLTGDVVHKRWFEMNKRENENTKQYTTSFHAIVSCAKKSDTPCLCLFISFHRVEIWGATAARYGRLNLPVKQTTRQTLLEKGRKVAQKFPAKISRSVMICVCSRGDDGIVIIRGIRLKCLIKFSFSSSSSNSIGNEWNVAENWQRKFDFGAHFPHLIFRWNWKTPSCGACSV